MVVPLLIGVAGLLATGFVTASFVSSIAQPLAIVAGLVVGGGLLYRLEESGFVDGYFSVSEIGFLANGVLSGIVAFFVYVAVNGFVTASSVLLAVVVMVLVAALVLRPGLVVMFLDRVLDMLGGD